MVGSKLLVRGQILVVYALSQNFGWLHGWVSPGLEWNSEGKSFYYP